MPEQAEAVSAVLEDGSQVSIRSVDPQCEPAVAALYARLGNRSIRPRFSVEWGPAAGVGGKAVVPALSGQAVTAWANHELVGIAAYQGVRSSRRAEVTLAVSQRWRSRGVGTLLLEHLVSRARQRGIESFHADLPAGDFETLCVLAELGLAREPRATTGTGAGSRTVAAGDALGITRRQGGSVALDLSLRYDECYLEAVAERESRADVRSLRPVFAPRSVAVVAASLSADSIGDAIVRHLLAAGFRGLVYPVSPNAARVGDLRAYPSVSALPEVPDLVVAAINAQAVPDMAEECGQCGVGGLVILSSGFNDEDGCRLRQAVRHYSMRMVGPNCVGIANTEPSVALNASLIEQIAVPGSVGVLTQSAEMGSALSESLHSIGLGVSTFASLGDEHDVSGTDLLMWWRHDDRTKAAVICLDSFANPRKFARLARQLSRRIPVVAVRGSASMADQAVSLPVAATAAPAIIRDALFRQAGVVVADDPAEAVEALACFSWQPLPSGRRVALICETGGAGTLAADMCARYGLQVPPLSARTRDALAAMLPDPGRVIANPVDMTMRVNAGLFGRVLETVAADPGIDAIIPILDVVTVVPSGQNPGSMLARVPVTAVLPGQPEAMTMCGRMPVYASITAAIRALAHAADYADSRSGEAGAVPEIAGIGKDAAEAAIVAFLAEHPGGGWLDGEALDAVVRGYGLPVAQPAAVQEIPPGTEMFVSFVKEPAFGALVQVGAATDPVVHGPARLLPLTDHDAREMIDSLPSAQPVDVPALTEVLHRVARLAADLPSASELHINPLIAYPGCCAAVDVRIRVAPASVVDPYLRQLR